MCEAIRGKKISGTVLLSHSQICSTIAAEVLNYRVREGNVCDYLAISTGKYYNEKNDWKLASIRKHYLEANQLFES